MAAVYKLVSYDQKEKSEASYVFENVDAGTLSTDVSRFFTQRKYRLEEGTAEDGVYGIGNSVLRFFLGVFVKRYCFHIRISGGGGTTRLTVSKAMTGAMGGVLGYARMNKEFEQVTQALKNLPAA